MKWLDRCIDRFNSTKSKYSHNQVLFPIVQGSMFKDLRKISKDYITSKDLPGNANRRFVCWRTTRYYV